MIKTLTAYDFFVSTFEIQFKISPNQAIAEFRTETNPEQSLAEYCQEFVTEDDAITEEFNLWIEQAQDALDSYQLTLMEKHTERDVWAELNTDSGIKKDSLSNYRPAEFKQAFAIDTNFSDGTQTSRDIWDRTSGYHQATTILTEYGIFNPATTNKAHAAWMRVRKVERGGVEWISIGAIQINTYTGEFYCGAHRCKFANQLAYATGQNKEKLEYQILALLHHLGTHAPKNDRAYPYVPIKHVKAYRDGDSVKLDSHIKNCTNDKCKARHQQIINGTIEMGK